MKRAVLSDTALLIFALFALLALFRPALNGLPFADDWHNRVDHPEETLRRAFFELRPYKLFRPLQSLAIATSELATGGSSLLHVLQIVVHVTLLGLCLGLLQKWGAPSIAKWSCALLMAVSQLNGAALCGNDTFSLVLGTLTGCAAVNAFSDFLWGGGRSQYWAGLFLLTLALLSKESSLGYVILACTLFAQDRSWRGAIKKTWVDLVPVCALVLGYFGWRDFIGAESFSVGAQASFAVGPNLVRNAGQVGFAALIPVSTTSVFTALATRSWGAAAAGAIGALAVGGLVVRGFFSKFGWSGLLKAGVAASCIISTILPLRHVSELYSYALMPLVGLGFGLGCAEVARSKSHALRAVAIAGVILVLVSHARALRFNAVSMAANGIAARELVHELALNLTGLPIQSRVALIEPSKEIPDYSVYRMTGFRLVPADQVPALIGRPDLTIREFPEGAGPPQGETYAATLTLSKDRKLIPAAPE